MSSVRLLSLAAFALAATVSSAQADEWVELGRRQVNFNAEKDTIAVGHQGVFSKIKIGVRESPIRVLDLKVHFGNGSVQDVPVRLDIAQGGETRVIDLPGAARIIKKIVLTYKTKGGGGPGKRPGKRLRRALQGKATVIVWGKKETGGAAPAPKAPEAAPKPKHQEWVLLGTRDVKFSAEKDKIPVTAAEGVFTKLKFKVTQNGIHMLDMKVKFRNGEVQDVPLKFDIPKGGESRVIDLPGGGRIIKEVVLRYKSKGGVRGLIRGHASLKLFGRKIEGTAKDERPAAQPKPAAPAPKPAAGDWQQLGTTHVRANVERDAIQVTSAQGRFTKLRFHVERNRIQLLDMKVHFANGDVQDVPLRFSLAKGANSRVIDLAGNKRIIKKVVFWYKGLAGPAALTLWGKH